jgi:hypothetical protein
MGWKDLMNGNWLVICIFQQFNYQGADVERIKRLEAFKNIVIL